MRIATIVVRILLGFLFLFGSVTYLLHLYPEPELHGVIKTFSEGLQASGYIYVTIKLIELVCAIAFLTNRFVALACIVIFPITLNIFLLHAFVDTEQLPIGIFLLLANLFLAYTCRKSYAPLFLPK